MRLLLMFSLLALVGCSDSRHHPPELARTWYFKNLEFGNMPGFDSARVADHLALMRSYRVEELRPDGSFRLILPMPGEGGTPRALDTLEGDWSYNDEQKQLVMHIKDSGRQIIRYIAQVDSTQMVQNETGGDQAEPWKTVFCTSRQQ